MTSSDSCCGESNLKKRPWFLKPLTLVSLLATVLIILSYFLPVLTGFREAFSHYAEMMGWAIGLGFLFGGVLDYYIPKEYISKYLASKNRSTVFYAVGLGFLMSACSHGILALAMELHKKGASGPAVITFLLASPWTSLPITFMLIGFFGFKGLIIIFAALLVALITGFIFQWLDHKGWIERNKHSVAVKSDFSIKEDLKKRFKAYSWTWRQLTQDFRGIWKGVVMLADMVLWWMILGMIMASLFANFIPQHIFHTFFGATLLGLFLTMALATVLEVCSEGTAPLAFEIFKQTGAFGNTFAFLMGGVVTDYTEIGIVWMNLGKRTALWMVAVTLPQVFLLAWLFNSWLN